MEPIKEPTEYDLVLFTRDGVDYLAMVAKIHEDLVVDLIVRGLDPDEQCTFVERVYYHASNNCWSWPKEDKAWERRIKELEKRAY